YLSSLNDVATFEEFTGSAHELFFTAYERLQKDLEGAQCQQLILGGHSLGGLLACHALKLDQFSNFKKLGIAVGFGMTDDDKTHLFATKFYEKTLNIRRQLVCPALDSDFMFPWIKAEKEKLGLSNHRIHLITGLDDVVVGQMGMERFVEKLEQQGNTVSFEKPNKLPHHQPELAAAHIYAFLKKEFSLS
ncbi:MAG: hypothetical protein JNM93_07610, partial [Bacteriovoracaceae bacterium]|nr:hypothetical protein [Bacteriovoracaceae bacterium]